MAIDARYVHTNLIAKDWRQLADFYIQVFGCAPVPPERDLSGEVMERGTGVKRAHLVGMHLRLPGYGDNGPTLEVFHYEPQADEGHKAINRPGYGHLAFQVSDVEAARAEVLAHGGQAVGEVVTTRIATGAQVTWCYLSDPEGNFLEIQCWK